MVQIVMNPIQPEAIFTVSEFLDLTNEMLKPLRVTVQGEITSLTVRGAAVYFNLSDKQEKAILNCLVWRNKLSSMGVELKEGLEIQVIGSPNIYKPFGRFSFQADYISPVGEGALKLALERLKRQLQQAGYFDPTSKQSLPDYPQRIGLITSSQGDAINDFKTHLGSYGYQIFHFDVRVEGVQAVESIVKALEWFNTHPLNLDAIVLTRGGGSLESLQAFNSEPVAKAIFASKNPIVSAIGHENDVTISDLVADVRASTPTDAGKMLSYHWSRLATKLQSQQNELVAYMKRSLISAQALIRQQEHELIYLFMTRLEAYHQLVRYYDQSLSAFYPRLQQRLQQLEYAFQQNVGIWQQHQRQVVQHLQLYATDMSRGFGRFLVSWKRRLDSYQTQLQLSDPTLKLKQGYSIVKNSKQEVVRSVNQLLIGDPLWIRLYQGEVETTVKEVEEYGQQPEKI